MVEEQTIKGPAENCEPFARTRGEPCLKDGPRLFVVSSTRHSPTPISSDYLTLLCRGSLVGLAVTSASFLSLINCDSHRHNFEATS